MSVKMERWHGQIPVTKRVHSKYAGDVLAAHHIDVYRMTKRIADAALQSAQINLDSANRDHFYFRDYEPRVYMESKAVDRFIWLEVTSQPVKSTKRKGETMEEARGRAGRDAWVALWSLENGYQGHDHGRSGHGEHILQAAALGGALAAL